MKTEVLLIAAMVLCGIADCARADEVVPDCTKLLPAGGIEALPDCEKPDGTYQKCPLQLLRYRGCEIEVARHQLEDLQADLTLSLKERSAQTANAAWYRTEADGDRRELEALRGRRTSALFLALGAGASAATGTKLAVDRHVELGVGLLVAGVVGALAAYVLISR